jgi:uncharacterized membrane protein (DUF4010 family)
MQDTVKIITNAVQSVQQGLTYEQLFNIFKELGIAILIGLLIGLEREHSRGKGEKGFAGVRTFPLIALMGYISSFIASFTSLYMYIIFFGSFVIMVSISYFTTASKGRIGITTEMAALLVFIIGSLIFWKYIRIAAIVAVIMAVFLSLKVQLKTFVEKVTEEDIFATLKLAIVTIIILPLLPDTPLGPYNLINLRIMWYMVIFIAGISFVGYIMMKLIGYKKGISLTGIFGGVVSSTALTFSFAKKSKENESLSPNYAVGIILASTMVYPKVFIEILVVNSTLLGHIWIPLLFLTITGVLTSFLIFKKMQNDSITDVQISNPFELKSALYFGVLFGAILILAKLSQMYFGDKGTYLVSILGGLPNIDAVTISMAQLSGKGISEAVARNAIIFALLSNTFFKLGLASLTGSKILIKHIFIGFGILISASAIILIFFFTF